MKRLPSIHPLRRRPQQPALNRLRRGSVLIIVLVIILLLTYGVYGFTERMLTEAEAANAHGRSVQAMAFAQSGVELATSTVTSRAADPENPVSLYHVPELYGGIVMQPSNTPAAVGRFSLVAPVEGDPSARLVRFGLVDESGKLNLNAIPSMGLDEVDEHYLLMALPGMTDDIADAILDYIDEDSDIRPMGAEDEFYQTLVPPYFAKNGPLESLDELLMVRGVTPELLYGKDTNRNGLLDPSEDHGDDFLLTGWHSYLTIHSRESNLRGDGTQKIHINQPMLTDLYDAVEPDLGEDAARFIVAYRMYGPNDGEAESLAQSSSNRSSGDGSGDRTNGDASGERRSSRSSDESRGERSSSSREGTSRRPTSDEAAQMDRLAGGLARMLGGGEEDGLVTRGGLDLSTGPRYEITSLYDLIDREVDVPADEEKDIEAETITSPWTSGGIATDYPLLFGMFSPTESTSLTGRINVNEARLEVLYGLPGMPPQLAESIVAARGAGGQVQSLTPERQTTAWLVAQGVMDIETMREFDKYLTGRGDVFRVQSVGFFDGGGPQARVEAVIDGTVVPAQIIAFRDLTSLGRGFAPSQLIPNSGQSGF